MRITVLLVASLLAVAGVGQAGLLKFDEVPLQPVNTLSPPIPGVSFAFTFDGSPSLDAVYNYDASGNSFTYLSGSVLEGDSRGSLTISFTNPTSFLQFGVALATFNAQTPGVHILLSGPGFVPSTSFDLNLTPGASFAEGQFTSSGSLISSAVITFNSGDAPRFALDNLSYDGELVGSPEPATFLFLGSGLLGLAAWAHRRRN
jgi:hypothetical protein